MKGKMALLAVLAWAGSAGAHHVWLEQDGGEAALFFGEFGMNLHEVSAPGGLLNKLLDTRARIVSADGSRELSLTKGPNSLAAPARIAAGESIVAEVLGYPLYEQKTANGPVQTWFRPAARVVSTFDATVPALPLDIVPTGTANQFAVTFNGKPLARTQVKVLIPAGWTREIRTNADGLITVPLPWKSWYALQVSHVDATPGQRGTESYGQTSLVTTLTLRAQEGLEAPAAPPPAAPYIEKVGS